MKSRPIVFTVIALLSAVFPVGAAIPVLDAPIPEEGQPVRVAPNIPVGKTLLFPITASDDDGDALQFEVRSSNPKIMVRAKTGNPCLRMTVTHADGGAADPAYTTTMEFMLFRDWLPITSSYVAGMAQAGFYDNVLFHRLADLGGGQGTTGFIFQAGDPLGTGGGGPGMTANDPATSWKFQNEFHEGTIFSGRGQLAMANAGTQTGYSLGANGTLIVPDYLDTNGSQFFITDGQPRHLDFKHNIFGQMLRGWDALPLLKATKTASARPEKDLKIVTAAIVPNQTDAVLVLSARAVGTSVITVTVRDASGAKVSKSFTVHAVKDESNSGPFIRRVTPLVTPKDTPAVFALEAVDLEFDYTDVQHSMLPLSASLGPKGSLLAQSGRIVQMQPNAGYAGLINMGFSIRQFSIGAGRFDAISDYTNSYIAAGDRAGRSDGLMIEASAGVALTDVIAGAMQDLDLGGAPGNFTAKINWGDGTPLSTATVARDASVPSSNHFVALGTHTYVRPGIYPVVVEFLGNMGARVISRNTAWVSNGSLRAVGEDFPLNSGRLVNRIIATFTDATAGEPADYIATINWGDGFNSLGIIAQHPQSGEFFVRGTHGWRDSEPYHVRVRIHKKNTAPSEDAIAWTRVEPQFKTAPHLPPFPHPKLTIAWNSGPNKLQQGTPGAGYQVTYSGVFVIINTGNRKLGDSKLRFWLSNDRFLNTTGINKDLPVKVNKQPLLNIIPFPAGAGGSGQFVLTMPKGESTGRKFLLAEAVYKDPVADHDGTDKVIVTGPLPPSILITPQLPPNAPALSTLRTTEGGGTATFTVVLDTAPINTAAAGQPSNSKVTIPLESSSIAEGTVSPSQLEFNETDWFLPQTATVTGVNDAVVDGNKNYKVLLKAAQSADSLYNGLVGGEVSLVNEDND